MANTTSTTTTNNTTKREYFDALIKFVSKMNAENFPEGTLDFLKNEAELLDKRAAQKDASIKATNGLTDTVLEVLGDFGKAVTLTEMLTDDRLKMVTVVEGNKTVQKPLSVQRLSALMKKLKDNGKVVRTEEKKKAYFSLT